MTKTQRFLLFSLLLIGFHGSVGFSQAAPGFVGAEGGMSFYFSDGAKKDFMRSSASAMSYNPSGGVSSYIQKSYAGLKYEHRFTNNRIGMFTGIRFSRLYSSIGRSGVSEGNSGYFYVLVEEQGLDTRYIRVKEINQTADYLGVPLEFRFFVSRAKRVRFYLKAGAECSFRIAQNREVVYQDAAMANYTDWLLNQIDKPKAVVGSAFLSPGIRFFPDKYPGLNLEVHILTFMLPSDAVGMLNSEAGAGFQVNLQVPLSVFGSGTNNTQ